MPFSVGRRIVEFQDGVGGGDGVVEEEHDRWEAAAREGIAELWAQIEKLTRRLDGRGEVLSRLVIRRETMTDTLSGEETATDAGAESDAGRAGSPVGVRLVPQWTPGLEVEVLPGSYRDIVEILMGAVHHLCAVLGPSTDKSKVDGFRSKLKRLVEWGRLVEQRQGRAASFLTCLIDCPSCPDALLLPHDQVGQDAHNGAREPVCLLLQGRLDLRARHEEAHLTAPEVGGRAALAVGRTRLKKRHRRQMATVVGTVTVTRCALRAPNRPNCCPADAVLGLPGGRHTLGLRRRVVLEAVRGSYEQALGEVGRHCGTRPLGKRQAEQLVRAAAVDIAAFYAARSPRDAAGAQRRRQGDRDAPRPSAQGRRACHPHPSVGRGEDRAQADGDPGGGA